MELEMQGVSISRAIAIAASTIFKRTSCIKKSTGGLAKDLELVGRLKSSEATRLVTRMTRMNLLPFPDRTCTNNIEYNHEYVKYVKKYMPKRSKKFQLRPPGTLDAKLTHSLGGILP